MGARVLYPIFEIRSVYLIFLYMASVAAFSLGANPQLSIDAYLMNTHQKIHSLQEGEEPKEKVHLVMGNSSADMDSIASAIAFAYFNNNPKIFFVPLANLPKEDLRLRGDVLYVFKRLGIDPSHLLYQEDLPFLLHLVDQGKLRVTLVDHNRLAPDQQAFKNSVERIIDHHQDEQVVYPLLLPKEKHIEKMGSNSTLIAKVMFSDPAANVPPQLAFLLLSAILLDTGNLQKPGITTEEDVRMARFLKEKWGKEDTDHLYEDLIQARTDVTHLTPDLLLKKDYKVYQEGSLLYGIASLPKGVVWNPENRAEWAPAVIQSLEKQQLHFLSALAFEKDHKVFIVYIPEKKEQKAFLQHVRSTPALKEVLLLKEAFPEEGFFFFDLKTPLARKELQPLFKFEK